MSTKRNFTEKIVSFLPLKTVFLLIFTVVVLIIVSLSNSVFSKITENYKNTLYEETSEHILTQYNMLFNERLKNSLVLASTIAQYNSIKNYFLTEGKQELDLKNILENLHSRKEYVDLQMELLSKEGISMQRSWTNIVGDNIFQNNLYLNNLLLESKVLSTVESNKFGLTISSKIPIKNRTETLGYFGLNIQFDDMLEQFEKNGFKSIILLNKEDSSRIDQENAHSTNFLDDHYIVNKNADSYIIKLVKQSGINDYFLTNWVKPFRVNENSGYLISKQAIKNSDGYTLAYLFMFKNIEEISMKELDYIQDAHVTTTMLIILFIAFVLTFFYYRIKMKMIIKENRALIIKNEELQIRADEMDYHDKKLENLFNMQPNLMMMHNGREITEANKRFEGFFNRFGSVDGFRQKHKCVGEFFVKYDAPYYIHEQIIEGKYWVDYILENPKRLYKVVIPYEDKKMKKDHHFIVKLNELKYAGKVDERLIIIALVDITQDLVNYKTTSDLDVGNNDK